MRERSTRTRRACLLGAALVLGVLLAGCERQGFRFTVTFPGPLDVEEGALVRYQGVPVGGITGISLGQSAPSEPGRVELEVVIDASDIVIREDDVFEIASEGLLGDSYLRVTPAPESSAPLEPGATVAGRAPLSTRITETTEEALARLGVIARQQAEKLADTIAEQLDQEKLRPDTPADPNAQAPAQPAPTDAGDAAAP